MISENQNEGSQVKLKRRKTERACISKGLESETGKHQFVILLSLKCDLDNHILLSCSCVCDDDCYNVHDFMLEALAEDAGITEHER